MSVAELQYQCNNNLNIQVTIRDNKIQKPGCHSKAQVNMLKKQCLLQSLKSSVKTNYKVRL